MFQPNRKLASPGGAGLQVQQLHGFSDGGTQSLTEVQAGGNSQP